MLEGLVRQPRGKRRTIALVVALFVMLSGGAVALLAGSLVASDGPARSSASQPSDVPGMSLVTPELPGLSNSPQLASTGAARGPRLVVPILVYHYILDVRPNPSNVLLYNLSISPRLFAEQMAMLHVEGATPISLAMLLDALNGRRSLPPHPVVLTFDDGYADFATAAEPVLLKYGFVGTDFVVSGFVGHSGYMSAAQVKQMDADGMVIGSHTVHHVDLATVAPAVAQAEIDGGKAALERLLGHPVLDFAYPYGGFDSTVEQLVRSAGFRDAVTTNGGDVQTLGDAFALLRAHMGGAPSLDTFARLVGLPLPTATDDAVISRDTTPARLAVLAD